MSFVLFDKLRLLFKSANIYGHEGLLQNQSDIDKVFPNGADGVDLTDPNFLLEQTNVQINRLERYKDYDQMDEVGEISLALDMYADESSLRDPERNHSVFVKTSSTRLKNEIEEFLYDTLNIDSEIRPMSRYLAKYGDLPLEIIPTQNRDGVARIKPMQAYNFTRVETKYGDLVGFFFQEEGGEPSYLHPWQVAHIRLSSFEKIFHPYGRGILDGARRDFRRLRLMEDAALVYRLVRAPEKRLFKVPVGNLPPKEREQYIQIIARRFKKHKFIDPATGELNERYAPHIQDDDYWVPVTSDGSGVEVETLQGAENLDAIADIEYFKKKMISALKIPFHRVGIGESQGDPGKSIASQSPEFAKAVQWLQDQIIVGIKKVILVHLALKNYPIDDLRDFEIKMTSASAIDELYRIETWASRVDIMGGLKDIEIFSEDWIVEHFTDMTADELHLNNLKKEAQSSKGGDEEGGEEDFFEDKRISNLITEIRNADIKDLQQKITEEKIKYSNHISFNKMLNENEFDGIEDSGNSDKYITEDPDKSNAIESVKQLLTEDMFFDTLFEDEDD